MLRLSLALARRLALPVSLGLALAAPLALPAAAQVINPAPSLPQGRQGVFAVTNARLVTMGPQGVIERGTIVIRGSRIEAIGANVAVPSGAEVIDGTGLEVYPGLIDGGSAAGLVEVGSVPETNDNNDLGDVIPHFQALTAVNPNSEVIPVTRVGGVTTIVTEPSGGLFPGTAAVIRLHGYTPDQMLVSPDARFVVLEFPRTGRRGPFDQRSEDDIKKAADRALQKLNDTWDAAVTYGRIDSAAVASPEPGRARAYTPALAALAQVARGQRALLVRVDVAADIEKALDWVKAKRVPRVILSGLMEGWRVRDKIAASGLPVLAGPVLAVPTRGSDRYDRAYANPGLMAAAGVRVAIRSGETENTRNLPFHAGFAAAYGWNRDAALRAVTIDAARILGVDREIGSLEAGKVADVIVTTGDPLEARTHLRRLFMNGYDVPLRSRHTDLYREFLQRNPPASN